MAPVHMIEIMLREPEYNNASLFTTLTASSNSTSNFAVKGPVDPGYKEAFFTVVALCLFIQVLSIGVWFSFRTMQTSWVDGISFTTENLLRRIVKRLSMEEEEDREDFRQYLIGEIARLYIRGPCIRHEMTKDALL